MVYSEVHHSRYFKRHEAGKFGEIMFIQECKASGNSDVRNWFDPPEAVLRQNNNLSCCFKSTTVQLSPKSGQFTANVLCLDRI